MGAISRRDVIGAGMSISALGLGSAALALEASGYPTPASALRVMNLLIDTRFDDAREIARQFAAPDSDVIALPRDVLELWHSRLAPALAATRLTPDVAIAGVTTEHGFFLLRTLAADQRFHVWSATVHEADAQREPLVSWVIGRRG